MCARRSISCRASGTGSRKGACTWRSWPPASAPTAACWRRRPRDTSSSHPTTACCRFCRRTRTSWGCRFQWTPRPPSKRATYSRRWRASSPWARHCHTWVIPSPRCTAPRSPRSEEHTSELQSRVDLVCRLLLEKKKKKTKIEIKNRKKIDKKDKKCKVIIVNSVRIPINSIHHEETRLVLTRQECDNRRVRIVTE